MTTDRIHFTQEKETNLIMLYAKAVQSQWQNPIMLDPWAKMLSATLITISAKQSGVR